MPLPPAAGRRGEKGIRRVKDLRVIGPALPQRSIPVLQGHCPFPLAGGGRCGMGWDGMGWEQKSSPCSLRLAVHLGARLGLPHPEEQAPSKIWSSQ